MNLVSQSITRDGIRLEDTQGRVFLMTKAQVQAIYQAQTGSAASKKSKTIAAVHALADAALPDCGFGVGSGVRWTADFNPADGSFATLAWELE